MKRVVILLLNVSFITACSRQDSGDNLLGFWEHETDSSRHCTITRSGQNYIVEFSHSGFFDLTEEELYLKETKTLPAFYDKSKDKLVIKWVKDIDAIYDKNSNKMVVESWGAFKKISK